MDIDGYLKQYVSSYYIVLALCIGILYFFNLPKAKRNKQIGVAKFFLISTALVFVCLFAGYATRNSSSLKDSIFSNFVNPRTEFYEICVCAILFFGAIKKFLNKISTNSNSNAEITPRKSMYVEYKTVDTPSKLEKFFYDKDKGVGRRRLVGKIALVISVSLCIIYALRPILISFLQLEIVFSTVGLLLVIISLLELFYSLNGEEEAPVVEKKPDVPVTNLLQIALNTIIKLKTSENLNLNNQMIGSNKVILNGSSALVCEVTNSNEIREITLKVMNTAFFEKKRVLVVSLNNKKAQESHTRLSYYNKEYDGKLIIKLLSEDDKLFDSVAEIYVTAIENCFGNIKLLSEIDTIIFEDYGELLMKKLELLRALGGIMKMGNSKLNFVVLTYNFLGIEATLKSLLYVNTVNYYCTETKQQPDEVDINVYEGSPTLITTKAFGNPLKNIGSLVPLGLLGAKYSPDRILFISQNEPVNFELNELNSIRNLYEKNIENVDLKVLSDKKEICSNAKNLRYFKRNWIVSDDKSNLYEKIYKLSLINGRNNSINIASEKYLLRDYMINTYGSHKSMIKEYLPYVPYEVNSGKVVLYNLLLQLSNYGVKESVIYNIFNENDIKIEVIDGNNIKYIANCLNDFIEKEFDTKIDGVTTHLKVSSMNITIKSQDAKSINKHLLTLVLVKGFGDTDAYMALITSRKVSGKDKVLQVLRDYILRWKIEENFKFKKQQYGLEKIKVRRYKRIQTLNNLLSMVMVINNIINLKALGKTLRKEINQIRKNIHMWLYRLTDGIKKIIKIISSEIMQRLYPKRQPRRRDLFTVMHVPFRMA